MEKVQCVVIGAGVVGLAIARELARSGKEVILVDKASNIGTETSSRNSEVIHAGIYYPSNSLKANLCVQGKQLLYQFCDDFGVPYKKIGKLIVASNQQQERQLINIEQRAIANNVLDLRWLDASQVSDLEPNIKANCALFSPSSGIIDSHQLMLSLLGDFNKYGGQVVFNTSFESGEFLSPGWKLSFKDRQSYYLNSDYVINSAGLHAVEVAKNFKKTDLSDLPKQYYAKGNYFSCNTKYQVKHLIYPIPEEAGLGIHLTLDLAGNIRFGPDVEWINSIDYKVNESALPKFYRAIRNYLPSLPDNSLSPDYVGVRPKIQPSKTQDTDFLIQDSLHKGQPGLIHLFGIESPGLTACLSIANLVASKIQ